MVEVIPNTAAAQSCGAGSAAAQLVADAGAEAVIGRRFGPNVFQALAAGGLTVYECMGGAVRHALGALRTGQLQEIAGPTVQAHSGMSRGATGSASGPVAGLNLAGGSPGAGMGRGMGRGRGGGGGGRGSGMGMGMEAMPPVAPQAADSSVLRQLIDMVNELSKQVGTLSERVGRIEKRRL